MNYHYLLLLHSLEIIMRCKLPTFLQFFSNWVNSIEKAKMKTFIQIMAIIEFTEIVPKKIGIRGNIKV